jgi:hypothetical protein
MPEVLFRSEKSARRPGQSHLLRPEAPPLAQQLSAEEATMSNSEEREREATNSWVDTAAEMGEEALSVITHEEFLEHIPLVKLGIAVARAAASIRDQLLLKKILAFLRGLSSISKEQREEMVQRLAEDRHYSESVGEYLIELLDRLDGRRKTLMAAAAFRAFAEKNIDVRTLFRLTHAIEMVQLREMSTMRKSKEKLAKGMLYVDQDADGISMQSLSGANLLVPIVGATSGGKVAAWNLTDLGEQFLNLELDLIPYKEA